MGILEIHFHDSQFEWNIGPETDREKSLTFGVGNEAEETAGGESRPSVASKLRSLAVLALVVGAAVAFNRLQSRRAQKAREGETESKGGRLSLSRST